MDRECMRESMRKLALWYTKRFKPISTHEELEPIMVTLGFVGHLPAPNPVGLTCKEYTYSAEAACRSKMDGWTTEPPPPPRPRLPYPRIDGLHIYTYRAFIDAVNFYLQMYDFSDLFHVRGMPLSRNYDKNVKWRRMEEEGSVFVYREGTLDQATHSLYHFNKNSSDQSNDDDYGSSSSNNHKYKNAMIRNKINTASSLVLLKDIV